MKLKFTRKTWYFFCWLQRQCPCWAALPCWAEWIFRAGNDRVLPYRHRGAVSGGAKGRTGKGKAQLHRRVRGADAQQAGCQRLGGDICSALVWPALLATEYERGKPIQRQLQLVSAAEVLRLVFWMLTKYAGMSGLALLDEYPVRAADLRPGLGRAYPV